jgi:hypothetical protein
MRSRDNLTIRGEIPTVGKVTRATDLLWGSQRPGPQETSLRAVRHPSCVQAGVELRRGSAIGRRGFSSNPAGLPSVCCVGHLYISRVERDSKCLLARDRPSVTNIFICCLIHPFDAGDFDAGEDVLAPPPRSLAKTKLRSSLRVVFKGR